MTSGRVSKGAFFAAREALTAAEKELIGYYDINWALKHYVPTITEVTEFLKKKHKNITEISVNYYLQRRLVIKGLDARGIPWRQHSQNELTNQQVAVATVMMNFSDVRSNTDKLAQLGVLPDTYNAWLRDPQFKALVDSLADQNLANIRPTAVTEFTKKINSGDWNAIKYWLDTTGEMQQDAPQSEVLLRMLIEIIQKHVKDPEIIIAIAQDIKLAAANRTLEVVAPRAIESHVVEDDPEFEAAKKMIGFG